MLLILPANTIFEDISKLAPEDSSMSKGQPKTVAPKEPKESIFTRFTVFENAPVYIFSPYLAFNNCVLSSSSLSEEGEKKTFVFYSSHFSSSFLPLLMMMS